MSSVGSNASASPNVQHERRCLDPRVGLQALLDVLVTTGYRVVGPVLRDGVLQYDDIADEAEMPTGCTVEQSPGRWRVTNSSEATRFSWTPGADSWKRFVFPARAEVLRIRRTDGSWVTTRPPAPDRPLALIGARDCEVRALGILDRVMLDPDHPDTRYAERRHDAFVVAVTCGAPSSTCWCTSMGGGPEPRDGFDIRLTELSGEGPEPHRLLAEAATPRGALVVQQLPGWAVTDADDDAAQEVVSRSVALMPQRLPGAELPRLLAGADQHPHWDVVAERCLSCGNCTLVCPTCFCSTFTDHTPLGTDDAVRVQTWASCFELEHSHLGGRPVRATTAARYRQWLTHKLSTWNEQFGTHGCVGCGRCTTWCPAGIDIVDEANVLRGGLE
ncbi:MAG: 4Fe-4S dicluster domain-containing protein [Ilumatobacteraceae bacterium]